MPHVRFRARKKTPKRVLALPDLEHAKSAVLSSLTSRSGQRTYDHAIREFVAWYCSEPRLAFNRTVVLRYRIHLEQRGYAWTTAAAITGARLSRHHQGRAGLWGRGVAQGALGGRPRGGGAGRRAGSDPGGVWRLCARVRAGAIDLGRAFARYRLAGRPVRRSM